MVEGLRLQGEPGVLVGVGDRVPVGVGNRSRARVTARGGLRVAVHAAQIGRLGRGDRVRVRPRGAPGRGDHLTVAAPLVPSALGVGHQRRVVAVPRGRALVVVVGVLGRRGGLTADVVDPLDLGHRVLLEPVRDHRGVRWVPVLLIAQPGVLGGRGQIRGGRGLAAVRGGVGHIGLAAGLVVDHVKPVVQHLRPAIGVGHPVHHLDVAERHRRHGQRGGALPAGSGDRVQP